MTKFVPSKIFGVDKYKLEQIQDDVSKKQKMFNQIHSNLKGKNETQENKMTTKRHMKKWKKSEVKKLVEIVSMAKKQGDKEAAFKLASEQLGRTMVTCQWKYSEIKRKGMVKPVVKPVAKQPDAKVMQDTQDKTAVLVGYIMVALVSGGLGVLFGMGL